MKEFKDILVAVENMLTIEELEHIFTHYGERLVLDNGRISGVEFDADIIISQLFKN